LVHFLERDESEEVHSYDLPLGYQSFKDAKSLYVREKIKKAEWKDRWYIVDLLWLEACVLDPPRSWAYGMKCDHLIQRYFDDWLAILQELRPKDWRKFVEEEKKWNPHLFESEEERRRKLERQREEERRETERIKRSWIELGGRE
jgi:hypothetical protein